MIATVFLCLSASSLYLLCVIALASIASASSVELRAAADQMMNARFQAILKCVPKGVSVADIGGDHGKIACTLASTNHPVYYTDVSPLSAQGAKERLESMHLTDKVAFYIGDGLQPLLDHRHECDTLVMAGMGVGTTAKIINHDAKGHRYRTSSYTFGAATSALSQLRANRLVLQPWPPYLTKLHKLYRALIENNFVYENQYITFADDQYYVTTSLIKRPQQAGSDDRPPDDRLAGLPMPPRLGEGAGDAMTKEYDDKMDAYVFNNQPLAAKCLAGSLCDYEKTHWKGYLQFQQQSVRRHLVNRGPESDPYMRNLDVAIADCLRHL